MPTENRSILLKNTSLNFIIFSMSLAVDVLVLARKEQTNLFSMKIN
jgi:hypothetical protein